jgi:hypothetical protein
LDPNGNITIKWDVMSWTADGYVVSYSFTNSLLINVEASFSNFSVQYMDDYAFFSNMAGGCDNEQLPDIPPHHESRLDLIMDMG